MAFNAFPKLPMMRTLSKKQPQKTRKEGESQTKKEKPFFGKIERHSVLALRTPLSNISKMTNHWIIRVRDGQHFWNSSKDSLWGITKKFHPGFLKQAAEGDILWFLTNKLSGGKLIAVATFHLKKDRVLGPLIALTKTNEELGWTLSPGEWDVEIHYRDLYDLSNCDLTPEIKGQVGIRQYKPDTTSLVLPTEYTFIVKYSSAQKK